MLEKGLLLACVACLIVGAVSELGSQLHVFYAKLNCQWVQAKVCIVEKN